MDEPVDITCPFCREAIMLPYDRETNLCLHYWQRHAKLGSHCFCGTTFEGPPYKMVEHWRKEGGFDAHLLAHQLGLTGGKP